MEKHNNNLVGFYKQDKFPSDVWINKEYLVQLNITSNCPMNCDFCYIKKYGNTNLNFDSIKLLWKNLRKYSRELGLTYRLNLTGGDIFYYPNLKKLLNFIKNEKTITAVDPLINRFWKEDNFNLLKVIKDKINFIQMNSDIVQERDILLAESIGKKVVLKISLYNGLIKRNIEKIKQLSGKYDNVIVSIDLIIPQKGFSYPDNYYIFNNYNLIKKEIEKLKKIFGSKLWLLSTIVKRMVLGEVYFCPVPFGGMYVMPDEKIVPCSRYSHLETGFNIKNFDLLKYVKKFNKLCSNFCLFENKYFEEYWSSEDNPINFQGG